MGFIMCKVNAFLSVKKMSICLNGINGYQMKLGVSGAFTRGIKIWPRGEIRDFFFLRFCERFSGFRSSCPSCRPKFT